MRRHLRYLWYLMRHKWYVLIECWRLHVPLWTAIFHDWDKFLPDEWFPYARCFYAPDGSKQYRPDATFSKARLLHQNRNKHHWQFWILVWENGETECLPMPDRFRRELLADWRGAAKALDFPDLLGWYAEDRDKMRFHPDTRRWLEEQLGYRPGGDY